MSALGDRLGRYVETREHGDEHRVWLVVDHQSFCVTPYGCDDTDQAVWFREQLLTALERLVRTERIRLRMSRAGSEEPQDAPAEPGPAGQPRLPF